MHMLLDLLIGLLGVTIVLADRAPYEIDDDGVKLVQVQRFDGNLAECRPGEVCADVFNFTRTMDDGSRQRESRFIQNCACRDEFLPCGSPADDPLVFRETTTQSMITCEPRSRFPVCQPGEICKEQHNLGNFVYYKINCVCPNNESPSDFYNKMTVRASWGMQPSVRLYKCRE